MGSCIALVVAAGRGHRFGSEMPKQYLDLAGKPVLSYALAAFKAHPQVDDIRVVIHPDDRELYDQAAKGLDLLEPVHGGASRQDSVRLGLESLSKLSPALVLIHDGARPFIDNGIISRTIDALSDHPGALPAVPVVDTIKRGKEGIVGETVDRSDLWRAQTPQGFRFQDILDAHLSAAGQDLTDDVAVAEHAGLSVALIDGHEDNFKITTADDLKRAERRLRGADMRTGMGFDVHRFTEGNSVTLCGVSIPYHKALKGHSNADVAMHALTDAIYGAVGAGDIGSHFPPSDEKWRGADSSIFLKHAVQTLADKGAHLTHLDITIICETPKIGPHRDAMVRLLSELLGLPADRVSVKATTTEGLGFTGRSEGIAAQAVVSVQAVV